MEEALQAKQQQAGTQEGDRHPNKTTQRAFSACFPCHCAQDHTCIISELSLSL